MEQEAKISHKRDAMEMCHRLIPMMTEGEIGILMFALNKTVERLILEGRVTED